MTVAEAARRLEVSPQTVYALIAGGRLACHRFGMGRGVIRISDEQLADYRERTTLAAKHVTAPAPPRPAAAPSRPRVKFRHLRAP